MIYLRFKLKSTRKRRILAQYVTEVIDEDYQKYLLKTLSMVAVEEITNEALIDVLQPRCIRISTNESTASTRLCF